MGFFQLGSPRLSVSHSHHHSGTLENCKEKFQSNKRFEHGPNIATMMHAANIMYRKRMESDSEVELVSSRIFA
ncbi:hypothetical protein ANCDUO_07363 [Ancylostoma duodenale]|uniref:Uncharacterized protein n=1 Tax=Ancylostoma duodenale TaxID=51022 RepID=A0A0C2DIQ3_9BILA|nr:hypothetical protein ANCDUO_07363 [Ancylostoma duodenale]